MVIAWFLSSWLLAMDHKMDHKVEIVIPMEVDDHQSEESYNGSPKHERIQGANRIRKRNEDYDILKKLINAIFDGDNQRVDQLLEENFVGYRNYIGLIQDYSVRLARDFAPTLGAVLKAQWPKDIEWPWPFSPVWLALEMVIKSKADKEPVEVYEKRLAILKNVFQAQGRSVEKLKLRKYTPPHSFSWWCFCCCVPLCCFCASVRGYPENRAAQADNVQALQILMSNQLRADDGEWDSYGYAIYFNAVNVLSYLKSKGFTNKQENCSCMENSRFLAYVNGDKETKELITDSWEYTKPMGFDGCC